MRALGGGGSAWASLPAPALPGGDGSRVRRRGGARGPAGPGAALRRAAAGGGRVPALPVRVRLGPGAEPLRAGHRPRPGAAQRAAAQGDAGGAARLRFLPGAGELSPEGVRAGSGARGAAAGGRAPQPAGPAAAAPHPPAHAAGGAAGRGHRGGRGAGRGRAGRAVGIGHRPGAPVTSPPPPPRPAVTPEVTSR